MFPGATEAHALPFATTNYEADEDGTLHAVLPSRCVYATGEQTCAMFVDHYRKRKTGPCYPVAVVGCRVHGKRRYTLYPAGHYPYGRVAVVPYSASGELLWEADRGGPPWQATLFGAAQDASQGQMWPSEQNWWQRWDARRRRTQGPAVGDGRTADRGQWGIEGAGARADRDAVGSGDHDRAVGRAPLGAQLAEPPRQRSWRCWGRWRAARRWGTAWVRLVRSAICGGRRARGWWRAGSRPARAGWWSGPAVPKRGNRTLPAARRAPPATKAPVGAVSGGATVGS